MNDETRRYKEALQLIRSMMGPLDNDHVKECIKCEGCLFEWEETLQVVNNVLNGKDPQDHWGPPIKIERRECP